jgi:hypothetical protein
MARFFKRNNKTTIAELEDYYASKSQRRNRPGMAWLMAFLSLLITVAVVALMYFGGRWLYRTITVNDVNDTSPTSINGPNIDLPTFTDNNGVDDRQAETDNGGSGVVSDEAATTNQPNQDRIATTGSQESLPETGPDQMIFVLPLLVAIFGYILARRSMIS